MLLEYKLVQTFWKFRLKQCLLKIKQGYKYFPHIYLADFLQPYTYASLVNFFTVFSIDRIGRHQLLTYLKVGYWVTFKAKYMLHSLFVNKIY